MAGWGDGRWDLMPWGGIAEIISQYIKIIRIKATNFIRMCIKPRQGS
jgi:hypothetical protein